MFQNLTHAYVLMNTQMNTLEHTRVHTITYVLTFSIHLIFYLSDLIAYTVLSWIPLSIWAAVAGRVFSADKVTILTVVLGGASLQLFVLAYVIYRDCLQHTNPEVL